jgi:hypothetical protein
MLRDFNPILLIVASCATLLSITAVKFNLLAQFGLDQRSPLLSDVSRPPHPTSDYLPRLLKHGKTIAVGDLVDESCQVLADLEKL